MCTELQSRRSNYIYTALDNAATHRAGIFDFDYINLLGGIFTDPIHYK